MALFDSSPQQFQRLAQRLPQLGVRTLVAVVCAAIVLAALGVAWLGQYAFQAQWQQQQQAQQRQLLQAWSQQLTLRLEPYQRTLLGLAQLAQEQGFTRLQQEKVLTAGFQALFLAHPGGLVEQLTPQRQARSQPLPLAVRTVRERALAQGALALYAQAAEGEVVQLTWAQPLRDAQGRLTALLLAQAEVPQTLLLPAAQSVAEVFGPQVFVLRDAETGVLVRSLASSPAGAASFGEELALAHPHWLLQSWVEASGGAPDLWSWGLLLPGIVVLCLSVGGLVRRQLLRGQLEGQPGAMALPVPGGAAACGEAFLQASPAAMWVVQGQIVQAANAHAYTLLGYAPQFLEGVWLHYVVREPGQLAAVQYGVRTAGQYHGSVQLRKADGEAVLAEVSAYRLREGSETAVWQLWAPWSQLPLPTALSQAGLVSQEVLLHWLQSYRQPWLDEAGGGTSPATGALLFLDVDCLGALNEAAGRSFGDHVLATVGRLLQRMVLPVGRAVHLGGDEFAALLPTIGVHHALLIAHQLCEQVQNWQPQWQGEPYWVSISIGVVAWDVRLHDGPGILRAADMACYQAKRKGKAQVVVGSV